ncbi:MBL fold metallo-hydrolase [Treponema sp. OMZ 840]|uniref:MBL fold metallo-hydrolase n=1 Tax=Treponema sp. OMZ 840 TaxID=244313 RepID=UPI003D902650
MKTCLKIIGSRAGSPIKGNPASGYLLKTEDGNILIDCGSGVVAQLEDCECANLIAVIITHRHADHCLDVMALAYKLTFPHLKKKIPLYCNQETKKTLLQYDKVFGIPTLKTMRTPIATSFDFHVVVTGEDFSVSDKYTFQTIKTVHPVDTMALKAVDFGFVFSADGAATDEFEAFCKGARVLLSEATYVTEAGHNLFEHGHMTASLVGRLAARTGVKKLIITHLADQNDAEITLDLVKKEFKGDVKLALPNLEISFD